MPRKAYSKEERIAIRENLIARAIEVFREKGFRNTTIDEVYIPVGISKTFFYTFFKSKNHLILEVIEEQYRLISKRFHENVWNYGADNGLRETFKDIASGKYYTATLDDRLYMRSAMTNDEYTKYMSNTIVRFSDILNTMGVPVSRMDPRTFYNLYMSIMLMRESEEGSIPFLFQETIDETVSFQQEWLIEYLRGLRVH